MVGEFLTVREVASSMWEIKEWGSVLGCEG